MKHIFGPWHYKVQELIIIYSHLDFVSNPSDKIITGQHFIVQQRIISIIYLSCKGLVNILLVYQSLNINEGASNKL